MIDCKLCNGRTKDFGIFQNREFVQCLVCQSVQVLPDYYLSPAAEKQRYLLHHNDIHDSGYLHFVKPLLQKITQDQDINHSALDYGCGTGPIIASELSKIGFTINLYDPYFKNDKKVLEQKYDFIICCEVMEHFQEPNYNFSLLSKLLHPNGKIYCKTSLFEPNSDFNGWHYKNDKTHVFFYTEESLRWITAHLNFTSVCIEPEAIIFTK